MYSKIASFSQLRIIQIQNNAALFSEPYLHATNHKYIIFHSYEKARRRTQIDKKKKKTVYLIDKSRNNHISSIYGLFIWYC